MSIYQFKGANTYRYRFQFRKKVYTGVCYGCETVHECIAYETKIKAAVMRLAEQKTIHELYENCRDMLIQREAISLESALDLALAKPMRKRPCERRLKAIRKVWGDFAYFMQKMYPGEQFVQSVTPAIAEQYIGLIRAHGNFEDFYNQRDSGRYSITTANIIHTTLIQIYNLLKNDTGMVENPFKSIKKLPQNTQSHEPYTVDELRTIFQHADDYIKPLFMIGLFSGMRLGDICTINKKDIQFDRHFIIKRMRKTCCPNTPRSTSRTPP